MSDTGRTKEVFPILTEILTSLEKVTDAVHHASSDSKVLSLFDTEIQKVSKFCLKITPNKKDFPTLNQILASLERMADAVHQVSSESEVLSQIDAEISNIARLCVTISSSWV